MANWITIGRIVLLFVGVDLMLRPEYLSVLLGAVIVIPVWFLSRLFGAPRGR